MQKKVAVTERALVQRINRKLAKDQEVVKKARGAATRDLGDYYRLDAFRNAVMESNVDLEALGRKLGVLRVFEALKETP